jgi:hypothetical protein
VKTRTGIADLPGFVDSLRLLLESERYSFTDIALMFGVTRERVRQLAAKFGIEGGGRAQRGLYDVRVWDDVAHRFVPRTRGDVAAENERNRRARARVELEERRIARRASLIEAIRSLSQSLGRSPTTLEVARVFNPNLTKNSAGGLLSWLWTSSKDREYARCSREMYEAAGCKVRGRGTLGHRNYTPKDVAA